MSELAKSMVVGCGGDQESKIGPLIDEAAKMRIVGIIQRAVEERVTVLLDGRDVQVPEYPRGNFMGPTILTGVETYMECYQKEILGPVLICMEVDMLDEAIDLINHSKCKWTSKRMEYVLRIQMGMDAPSSLRVESTRTLSSVESTLGRSGLISH